MTQPFDGFIGDRVPDQGGPALVYVVRGSDRKPLDPRNYIRDHSPDGFQWGYGGSGPAQLALAICCEVAGVPRGRRVYQDFKARIVASLPDHWELTRADVEREIVQIERARLERDERKMRREIADDD